MSRCTTTPGLHNDGCDCDTRITCPGCEKSLKRTTSGRYRKHGGGDCDFSETVIREDLCNESSSTVTYPNASSARPPGGDAPDTVSSVTPTTPSPPGMPVTADDATSSTPASVDAASPTPSTGSDTSPIPGVETYAEGLNDLATTQLAEYKARVDANLTPAPPRPPTPPVEQPPLFSQPVPFDGEPDYVPAVLFSQPAGRRSEEPPVPMSADAAELTARLKEMFYAYDNRRSEDNRSAQATMGPSEMGTPCDRRLALSLMRMPPVNPGGDGWAAFVGTCIHAGLESMFLWANAGTGRFAVEQRLEFPSKYVPKGTADLIDRTLFMLDDHKCQGRWSRNKLRTSGPSPTYRVQAHVYAYGARLKGEKIEKVAIISWPRDEATLEDLYVWTEDYNPQIVKDAFERVESIGKVVEPNLDESLESKARAAATFNVADDCRFCPFYLPNARDITRGCNGKL